MVICIRSGRRSSTERFDGVVERPGGQRRANASAQQQLRHPIMIQETGLLISRKVIDNSVVIKTTGDGNCLFNACSLSLLGNENMALNINLCTVFILLEYEAFFTYFLCELNPNISFEQSVVDTATNGI
jgi:hypothetical protein